MAFIEARDFNLEATIESAQIFGYRREPDGSFLLSVRGSVLRLHQNSERLCVQTVQGPAVSPETIRNYFDLDTPMEPLFRILEEEPPLLDALTAFRGLRIIRQNPWHATAAFIISANNNVKRIRGIWDRMCRFYGRHELDFPDTARLISEGPEALDRMGLGYRAKYLWATANAILCGPVEFRELYTLPLDEARRKAMAYAGVGPKVADCILLYGFHRPEAFPVDVWIARAMRRLFFRNRPASAARILAFASKRWGPWAGYVQQYIFHAARTIGSGT
ncbi:MAG: hypothetical protein HQL11_03450 [Candidatus Omnitrophica bacterium]|nr:hypothetical protein [Candidatus Omnitrophota bacterium]